MTETASLILPNQLVEQPVDADTTYLVEHPAYFTRFDFHVQKLVLHRASMQAYAEDRDLEYIPYHEAEEQIQQLFYSADRVRMYDPVDHRVRESLEATAEQTNTELEFTESPLFLNSQDWNKQYFADNNYFQHSYYKAVRRRHRILVENGDPVGGKWSFDPENRKKMPADVEPPSIPTFDSPYIAEATQYVRNHFSDNPGTLDSFQWPVTRQQALTNLDDFLENRLEQFGDYQDAIRTDVTTGFHSLLSASLNIGLITPEDVIKRTMEAHDQHDYPLNSLEGFLRQIVGWREFIRAMYELEPEMRNENLWNADNPLPDAFYTAETGLRPADTSIQNTLDNAYCHHIERLMILGNLMLLLEIDPDEVYRWFMELFIDSYDWVMVPNVYGMSQYAYTNMMTKPYISSSNYITKMSDYTGGDWGEQWDGLYWQFIHKHRDKIEDISRMAVMTSTLDRMNDDTVQEHLSAADEALDNVFDHS